MLLREVVLLVHVPLQRREDIALVQEVLPAVALEVQQRVIRNPTDVRRLLPSLGRNREILELFTEHDNRLLGQERILGGGRPKVGGGRAAFEELLLCGKQSARVRRGAVEVVARVLEEVEDIVEAVRVKLQGFVRANIEITTARTGNKCQEHVYAGKADTSKTRTSTP